MIFFTIFGIHSNLTTYSQGHVFFLRLRQTFNLTCIHNDSCISLINQSPKDHVLTSQQCVLCSSLCKRMFDHEKSRIKKLYSCSHSATYRPWSWTKCHSVQTPSAIHKMTQSATTIKAASSHERALTRAHVGVCAGRRPMRRAHYSRPSSVEQDVRITCIWRHHNKTLQQTRRKKWGFWSPVGDAISMCKFGHIYAFWVEPKCCLWSFG